MTEYSAPRRRPRDIVKLLQDFDDDQHVLDCQMAFLKTIWDIRNEASKTVFAFLGFKSARTGKWITCKVDMRDDHRWSKVVDFLERYSRWNYDQYFCPNLFSKPRRKIPHALSTRFAWCDMDASEPEDYKPRASVEWETSPGHFQGLWVWDRPHSPSEAEVFSHALTYRHGGDQNGWSRTKMLRIIGSLNHKPEYDEPFVRPLRCDWSAIEARPKPLSTRRKIAGAPASDFEVDPTAHDPGDVIERYSRTVHMKARYLMREKRASEPNRSGCIYFMVRELSEAGASPDEIASVIWVSPYFTDKHGQHPRQAQR